MEEEIDDNVYYDAFIRQGLCAGFTDDQIDFLWDKFELMSQVVNCKENKSSSSKVEK